MFKGLRFRLLVLVLLVSGPLIVLTLYTAGEDRRKQLTAFRQLAKTITDSTVAAEKELLGRTRQLLLAISESAAVTTLNRAAASRLLRELMVSYPEHENLFVVLPDGEVVASAKQEAEVDPDKVAISRALKSRRFSIGQYPKSPTARTPTLQMALPVIDPLGNVTSVVIASIELPEHRVWMGWDMDIPEHIIRGATWTRVSRSGHVIATSPNANDVRPGRPYPDRTLANRAFRQRSRVVKVENADGTDMLHVTGQVRSELIPGVTATILSIPESLLYAQADSNRNRSLALLGIAGGCALVFGWVGSNLLVLRPVKSLVRSIRRLASDALSPRPEKGFAGDELGQLTRGFDHLVRELEQRQAEQQTTTQRLQLLSHRLVEVQETERRQIARELHDEIGQTLTVAEMNLQAALREPRTSSLVRRLEDSIAAVDKVLAQVQDLSLNLRPSMLDDLGLEAALRWYTERQARLVGIDAKFRPAGLEERLHPTVETECFRIAQEALTNIVRHAKATAVLVQLTVQADELHLLVRDDGVGFDVSHEKNEAVKGASLGLLSMQERAALAGGRLVISSVDGQGTEVRAFFPLKFNPVIEVNE